MNFVYMPEGRRRIETDPTTIPQRTQLSACYERASRVDSLKHLTDNTANPAGADQSIKPDAHVPNLRNLNELQTQAHAMALCRPQSSRALLAPRNFRRIFCPSLPHTLIHCETWCQRLKITTNPFSSLRSKLCLSKIGFRHFRATLSISHIIRIW
jgi:hypothetical protein